MAQNNEFDTVDFTYETLPLQSYLSRPSILLVDNDWSFDNKGLKVNCVEDESAEQKYSRLLEDLGYSFDRFVVPSVGEGPDSTFMQVFDAVIWVMGDNPELLPEERIHIANYLENGGRFLIIFPDPYMYITYDPNTSLPNPSILNFFQTCMGISNGDNTSITPSTIRGVSGSIMDSVNTFAKSDWAADWSPTRNITDRAFVVSPLEDAEGLIHRWNTEYPYLAVAYSPASETMENTKKFKSIFIGFELTFVSDYEERKDIMEKALKWLIGPRVTATSVGDGYTEIPCHIPIRITFNKSMDLNFLTQSGAVSIDPAVPITMNLLDKNKSLEIRPDSSYNSGNWSSGTEYTITISDSFALDTDGQTLSLPFQLTFTGNAEADTTAPEVVSIDPPDGAVDVCQEQKIEITFNAPIDPTTINSSNFCVTQGEESVTGHFCYLRDKNKVVFSPHEVFMSGDVLVTLNGLRGINGTSASDFSAHFIVKKPAVSISEYVLKKGYQLISGVQPGMRCTLELTLKNQSLSPVEGIMVVLKPVSNNIYPHYKNDLGITTYGHFEAHQEKCADFSFTLSSAPASLGEKVVFDVYSSHNFSNIWQGPNNLWQDSNSIWQDSNNIWRERITFAITGTDETPPNLHSSYITITPTRGIQQGTQTDLSVYVDEPGELGEVIAELRSLDNELHASIPLTDPEGDHFYEGTWDWEVDIEGYYYVNVKATDTSGNMSELEKVMYLQCQKFQSSAPFLVVYDYDSPLAPESLKQLFAWTQILHQTSVDFDLYVTGCEHDISYDILSRYSTVVWIIPQNSKSFCLNKTVIQDEIIQYLDGGGNLLIAGKDVSSYYIRNTGFYLDYLHAVYIQDSSLRTIVPAENTNPISGGIDLYRKEGDASEIDLNADSNSNVEPIYRYNGNSTSSGTAALRVITDTYGIVYFAFDLEGLWVKENIVELIKRSLVRLSPPLITAVNPPRGLIDVPLNSRIAIFFSEEMNTESVNNGFSIHPDISGNVLWDEESRQMIYDYSGDGQLSPETIYTITIGNTVFDQDRQNMQKSFSWSFTTGTKTDTTPPTLSITPAEGSGNVHSDTIIEIQFSEPMDITTIWEEKPKAVGSASGQIEGQLHYEYDVLEEKWKLTFDPYNELAGGEKITVTAGAGWKDITGHELTAVVSSFFTVRLSDQVYIVSSFPDTLEYGKFYPYFSVYIKNDSGADLYDVQATIETSSEFMNQPHPIAYNPFIEMEETYGWIGQGGIQNFYFGFYTPSECPENMDCSQDIHLPCIFRLSDGEDNRWTESFTLTISSPDLTPPEIVNIETDQHNGYVPANENITIRCFIKEPGQVKVKASLFSDSLSAVDEIKLSDPDNDRVFTGTYPQYDADYWLTLEATDAANNTAIIEKTLWFTSKPYKPDSQARIIVVFDYPKTGSNFDNYTSILHSYLEALDGCGYRHQYCLWETDVYGNISKEVMSQYALIIWIIPYSFYSYNQGLMDTVVQDDLMEYLDQGGNLLIAGDETVQIDSPESLLYRDYFHAEYSDLFDYGYDGTLLLAEENDLISHNLNLHLEAGNYYSGSYYYSCAQVIKPKEKDEEGEDNEDKSEQEAEVKILYTYEEYFGQGPGVAALRVTTRNYRLVYFAFDLDKILSADDRSEIMGRSLHWLFPPRILSVNPINESGDVAQNSTISLYFNKQMDTNSVESAFHIDPYLSGTFIWDMEKRHLLYDYINNELPPNTTYTITLGNTASDQGGQNMKETFSWSFTTGEFIDTTHPTLSITPSDPNAVVPPDSNIEIVFQEYMDKTTIDKEKPKVIGSISGLIDGHITYAYDDQLGKWKLTFAPDKNFIGREQITVNAPGGWKDAAGKVLTGEISSSFSIAKPEVYVVSFYPQFIEPGGFYSDFNITIKNNSGFDLNNVKAILETSSEFVNFPYPDSYKSYITMENDLWKIEYAQNAPNRTVDLFFDFYLRSDCPEGKECSEDMQIPFILYLTDGENNTWSDSFLLPVELSDTTPPELLLITMSNPDNYYVPLNEEMTLSCLVKEPGWVNVKAYLFSDPNFTCVSTDPNSNPNITGQEIQLRDPNHDSVFTGAYTPHSETEYWITIEATDLAGNKVLAENALHFTSIPFVPDPLANILVVFDYPKTGSTGSQDKSFDNYERILTRYLTGLNAGGYRFDIWEIYIYGNISTDILNDYDVVLWINPLYYSYYYPDYPDKGLTSSAMQDNLISYLDEGGNLLLAGQGTTDFTVTNSTLYSDYLHAEYREYFYYGLEGTLLSGKENDPISHGLNLYLEAGNYYETYGSIIRPYYPPFGEDAEVNVLYTYDEYSGQEEPVASLRVSMQNYHLVYFAFDLDKIERIDDFIAVMGRSVDWLCSPFIISVNPIDGLTDVPRNSTISLYFNKNMNSPSIESAFGIDPYVAGIFTWDSQKRHLVYDYSNSNSGPLLPDTEYRVTINDTASDLNGKNMKRGYAWSFTTGAYKDCNWPTLSIIPSDPNVDVSSESIIEMVFSEQMDITTIDREKPLVIGSASGPIEGQAVYDYDDQQEGWKLTFYPYNGFVGREQIIVMAGEGWKDMAGNELRSEVSSTFHITRPDIYIVSFDPNSLEPGKFYRDYPVRIKNESGFDLYEVKATLESCSESVNQPYAFVYKAYHNMKDISWNLQKDHSIDLYFDFYLHSKCPEIIKGTCSQERKIPFILRLTDNENNIWADSFFVSLDEFDTTPPEIGEIIKEQDNYYIPAKWLDPNGGITIKCFIKEPGPLKEVKAFLLSDPNSMGDELQLNDTNNDRIFTSTYIPQDEAEYQVTLVATDLANNTAVIKDGLCFTSKPFVPDSETSLLIVFDFPKTTSKYTYDTILKKYQDSLKTIGYRYDLWEIDVYGNIAGDVLAHYDMVIWIKPDYDNYYQHYQDKGLVNTSVQEDLMRYLDSGGNLLIAGEGTMFYSIYTSKFYGEYLHAEYTDYFDYGFDSTLLSAIEEDPISSGLDLYLGSFGSDYYTGVIDPLYLDPNEEAEVKILYMYDQYSGEASGTAALRVSAPRYHLVYFAFDLEVLENADNFTEIIEKSLKWLSPPLVFPLGTQQFIWNFSYTTDSYTIIRKFGHCISAIQRMNSCSGKWEAAYLLWGNPSGKNFPVMPGNTYFLSVTSPCVISLKEF